MALHEVVVVDDLRSFDTSLECYPYPDNVVVEYYRSSQEFLDVFMDGYHHIQELWLDHDLGGDDTIRGILNDLASMSVHDVGKVTIGTVYVITQNLAARNWMVDMATYFTDCVACIDPVPNALISAPIPDDELNYTGKEEKMGAVAENDETAVAAATEESIEAGAGTTEEMTEVATEDTTDA